MVPISSTLEIKTPVARKCLPLNEVTPQLWISQTPKLVRAFHTNGRFPDPKVEDVEAHVKQWEKQHGKDLKMLAELLRHVRYVVRQGGGRAELKYDTVEDKPAFRKLGGRRMLPEDLYKKWEAADA